MMASQNFCTPPGNLNQNSRGSVSIVRVGMKEIVEISSDDEDYEKPNTYYHGQIAVASAFSLSTPEPLSVARFILKRKAQTEEGLAAPKMAKYGTWEPAREHLENDVEIANVLETIQKSRRKKEVYFDAPMKLKAMTITKESEQKTIQSLNETEQNHSRTSPTPHTVSCATQTNSMSAATNPDTDAGLQHEEIFLKIVREGKISLSFEDMIHVSLSFGKFLCSLTTRPRSKTTAQSTAQVDSVGTYRTSDERLYIASTSHA